MGRPASSIHHPPPTAPCHDAQNQNPIPITVSTASGPKLHWAGQIEPTGCRIHKWQNKFMCRHPVPHFPLPTSPLPHVATRIKATCPTFATCCETVGEPTSDPKAKANRPRNRTLLVQGIISITSVVNSGYRVLKMLVVLIYIYSLDNF